MSILRKATEQSQSDWRPVPEGLWRWVIGEPELKMGEKYAKYLVRFPLTLTPDEQKRLEAEGGGLAEGVQQSWRSSYQAGLSLGYVQRDGQFKSTKLVDFLAACFGHSNAKNFRAWIAQGGGPPRPADKDDDKSELDNIAEWLKWWGGLELYGSIRHEPDSQGGEQVWARFGGPMAVGSLPGQQDIDYQAHGRGKLRGMIAECDAANQLSTAPAREVAAVGAAGAAAVSARYQEVFPEDSKAEDEPF